MTMNEPGSSELPAENVGCKPKILESIHGPASTSTCKYVKPGSVMHKKTEASPEASHDQQTTEPSKPQAYKRHVRSFSDCTGMSTLGLLHQSNSSIQLSQDHESTSDQNGKPTKPRFLDDGGSSIVIASAGQEYPKRQRGQSLVEYLMSNHTGKIGPELDRENAHFSVSEAMIAAIEEARFHDWTGRRECEEDYEILTSDLQDDSDEEIRQVSSQLKTVLGNKSQGVSIDCTISPSSSIATMTPTASPSTSLASNPGCIQIMKRTNPIDPLDSGISFTSICSAFEKERQKSRKLARLKRVRSRLIARNSGSFSSNEAASMPGTPVICTPSSERQGDTPSRRSLFPASAPSPIPSGRSLSTAIIPPLSESSVSAESVALSLLGHFSKLQVPISSDMEWLVSEKDAPQHLLPMPKSWPINPDDPFMQLKENDVEEASITSLRGNLEWAPPRPQIVFALYSSPNLKVVMAKQNYRCAGCGMKVEPEYSYIFRYCNYLGRYFCTACHSNKTFVIPSRIFKKWDFKKYPVSNFSFDLLERMWFDPLFRLGYINPLLYRRCRQLSKVLELRVQLIHVAEFLRICRFAEESWQDLRNKAKDWLEDPELYSLYDITRVNSGELIQILRGVVSRGIDHVLHCELCKARGFLCEMCHSSEVIFPFQTDNVVRCSKCGSCYHRPCWNETNCPRCQRIARRIQETAL